MGVGTNVRPLLNTESSTLESVSGDRLTTCYLVLKANGALLWKVLLLYPVNLHLCLSRLEAGCGWWVE